MSMCSTITNVKHQDLLTGAKDKVVMFGVVDVDLELTSKRNPEKISVGIVQEAISGIRFLTEEALCNLPC